MSGQPLPNPVFRANDNNGNPLVSGQLFSYIAGTSTPQATFTDSTLSVQNANPVVLNARGEAAVWLDPTLVYKFVLQDSLGNVIWTIDQVQETNLANITSTLIGSLIYPRSAGEISAGVTPTNFAWPVGDPRRYGAKGDGVTDDTSTLNVWASVGGALTLPALTFLISGPISFPSYTTVTGTTGAIILGATKDVSMFVCTSVTGVTFRDIHFKQTASAGTLAYTIGQVYFDQAAFCTVHGCIFENPQWSGVTMHAAQDCTARGNYFTGFTTQLNDQSDIALISSPSQGTANCVVDGNFCFGGGQHGVNIEDPYTFVACSRNVVTNNRIGTHTRYGVLVYQPSGNDTFNEIIGNHIEGITGAGGDGSSGNGIYCVNGIGGTIIANNVIRNCCINTSSTTLAPAGIGVSGLAINSTPLTITGNVIEGMTKYWGILATGILGNASISGNVVRMPASNNTGDAIRVTNSVDVTVSSNAITLLDTTNTQRAILFFAQGAACSNCAAIGNTIVGGNQSYIETAQTGGNTVSGLTISGNVGNSGTNNCTPLLLSNVTAADVLVTGNYFSGGTNPVVSITACTNVRMTNNRLKGTGTVVLQTSGVCTGGYYDRSNAGVAVGAGLSNGGTGFNVVLSGTGNSDPSAGTWAQGDIVFRTDATATQRLMTVCTTAGTGGGTAVFKTVSNT